MRQKIDDAACGMRVHTGEDVGDVVDGVDAVLLAASDERVEDGEVVTGILVADEEKVLTPMRTSVTDRRRRYAGRRRLCLEGGARAEINRGCS